MFQKIKDPKQIRNNYVVDASSTTITFATNTPITPPFNVATVTTGAALPYGICIDASGKNIYVVSYGNHCIFKYDVCANIVTGIAGLSGNHGNVNGVNTVARFNGPLFPCLEPSGVNLYVSDYNNNSIRKINVTTNTVSTLAGITVNTACGLCMNSSGTTLYATSFENNVIYKITNLNTTPVSTIIAGIYGSVGNVNGQLGISTLNNPIQLCVDPAESNLYFCDQGSGIIRQIQISNNYNVTTLAGLILNPGNADGANNVAKFRVPKGIITDASGEYVYVADTGNTEIRKVNTATGYTTTIAGKSTSTNGTPGYVDGSTANAQFAAPVHIIFDSTYQYLYLTDLNNNAIRRFQISTATSGTANITYKRLL